MKSFENLDNISVSASNLVKQSMKQLVYLMYKDMPNVPTTGQLQGNEYANQFNAQFKEMRGCVKPYKSFLFFSIDAIDKGIAYEIKMAGPTAPQWLFQMSVLQTSFYSSLLRNTKMLKTSTFYVNQGNPSQMIIIEGKPFKYILKYGDHGNYYVEPCEELYNFYMSKLKYLESCIEHNNLTKSIELAGQWDEQFKHKEIAMFFHKIKYTKCDPQTKLNLNLFSWIKNLLKSVKLSKIIKK